MNDPNALEAFTTEELQDELLKRHRSYVPMPRLRLAVGESDERGFNDVDPPSFSDEVQV